MRLGCKKMCVAILAILAVTLLFFLLNKPASAPEETADTDSTETTETPIPEDVSAAIEEKDDLIRIESPTPLSSVSSPINVGGEARGYWFFEGSFPLIVVDWDGRIIGEGYATAEDNWMAEDFVPFAGSVSYTLPPETAYKRGALIFRKDNPSGLPEYDDAFEIPIRFE